MSGQNHINNNQKGLLGRDILNVINALPEGTEVSVTIGLNDEFKTGKHFVKVGEESRRIIAELFDNETYYEFYSIEWEHLSSSGIPVFSVHLEQYT